MKRIILFSLCLALCACSHSSYTGQVSEVRQLRGGIVIDLGGTFPNQAMTVFIPRANEANVVLPNVGSTITIIGDIKDYRGRSEIVVTSSNQISLK